MSTPNIEELLASLTQTNQFYESADICTADVIAVLQSQAERIKQLIDSVNFKHSKITELENERDTLRHELKVAQEGWRCECSTDDACRFARERDALRAELGDLPEAQAEMLAEIKRLRAQLAELVEALEDLKRQYSEHPDAFWDWSKARTALSKYKGAK